MRNRPRVVYHQVYFSIRRLLGGPCSWSGRPRRGVSGTASTGLLRPNSPRSKTVISKVNAFRKWTLSGNSTLMLRRLADRCPLNPPQHHQILSTYQTLSTSVSRQSFVLGLRLKDLLGPVTRVKKKKKKKKDLHFVVPQAASERRGNTFKCFIFVY